MDNTEILAPLREVANIAAGNAATALSKLMKQQVIIAVPVVKLIAIEQVSAVLGPPSEVASAGLVKIEGDAKGLLLFAFSPDDADAMAQHIVTQHVSTPYRDVDQSVLREVVNIIAGAALSSLGTFLELQLWQSVPGSATDMLGAVLDPFVAELGTEFEKVLVLEEVFTIPVQGASIKMLMIVDPPSTTDILQKISEKISRPDAASN
jgi:chemotaxis protein CheC